MRVNIRGVWYDADKEPIRLALSDNDKSNVGAMLTTANNIVMYPDGMDYEEAKTLLEGGNKTLENDVKAKLYSLRDDKGTWLGNVVITTDGMCAGVTDWGNLSYQWNSFGADFRNFLLGLNSDYFGGKMYQGSAYIAHGKKIEKACDVYAYRILPALQKAIRLDLDAGVEW